MSDGARQEGRESDDDRRPGRYSRDDGPGDRPEGDSRDERPGDDGGFRRRGRPGGGGGGGGRYRSYFRKKVCKFCVGRSHVDYLDVGELRRFTTDRGKILPARVTGTCARHQRLLGLAIKRARALALLPYVAK